MHTIRWAIILIAASGCAGKDVHFEPPAGNCEMFVQKDSIVSKCGVRLHASSAAIRLLAQNRVFHMSDLSVAQLLASLEIATALEERSPIHGDVPERLLPLASRAEYVYLAEDRGQAVVKYEFGSEGVVVRLSDAGLITGAYTIY